MADHADTIERIRYWHLQRCFAMEQRKRLDLALGAHLRTMLGWSKDKPEAERKRIAAAAAKMIKDGGGEFADVIAASVLVREPFETIERRALREMSKLAESLSAWDLFGRDIRGFGAASLAVIVAEAGDISNYSTVAKLWKRMGLAVMNGVRQGGLPSNASAEAWIAHGHNRQRRSRVWNIGDSLIKGNRGVYRQIYLDRKAYEIARDPEMKPIKAHRRAQRYMEKRLLRDLWRAWRRAASDSLPTGFNTPPDNTFAQANLATTHRLNPNSFMSPDNISAQADPTTNGRVNTRLSLSSGNNSAQAEPTTNFGLNTRSHMSSAIHSAQADSATKPDLNLQNTTVVETSSPHASASAT